MKHSYSLGDYGVQVKEKLSRWKELEFLPRLWAKDPTLWHPGSDPEITGRLGWLQLPQKMQGEIDGLISFAGQVRKEGFSQAALLGMGGSSLTAEVFQKTFGNSEGYPALSILDSTHPDAVLSLERKLDLHRTLFCVSSKSGTTQETISLFRYFWSRIKQQTSEPGRQFIAITDPGTPLARLAEERKFREIFLAPPDVGGRFSAFSVFGLLPAALIGLDLAELLKRGKKAAQACRGRKTDSSWGLVLGAILGEVASTRDKLTFLAASSLSGFPDWLEQLVAESTGKDGQGIVPVVNEPAMAPENYGQDRLFVGLSLSGPEDQCQEELLKRLEALGHPVLRIRLDDKCDLGQEIFFWEVAVTAACSGLGVHPFDQPDVELAKELAWKAMEGKDSGKEGFDLEAGEIETPEGFKARFDNWLAQANKGDYFSIQAYLGPGLELTEPLQKLRGELQERTHLATTLDFGPRLLHSSGQLHKGGPNTGLFLQLVDTPRKDLQVPETDFTFGSLIQTQALGDFQALKLRERRVIRVNLREDAETWLNRIIAEIERK